MPLFEYECHACLHRFELLVRDSHPQLCPACGSRKIERLHSLFGVSSDSIRQATLKKARAAQTRVRRDKAIAEAEEAEHHRH